jgi:uncharacterized protein (DUF2141 family)
MKNISRRIIYISIVIILAACAKISSPAGGPRDRTPPVVVESEPVNGARNFRGKKLVVTFNEFVVLEKINDKFMVSPPMKKKPDVYIRGKNLIVEFDEQLRDSTTYTFNFQDAIRDLNEGNILENYQFVFSTGKVIDSLTAAGQVYNALTLEIPENISVLLYSNLADSAVKKLIPDYMSRIDPAGNFRINNIRPGRYRLYALKDMDNSKNYNLIKEEFAFMDTSVTVTPEKNYIRVVKDTTRTVKPKVLPPAKTKANTPVKPVAQVAVPDTVLGRSRSTLILFKATETNYYLTSSERKVAYRLTFSLSLPPQKMDFQMRIPDAPANSYFIERSRNRDTMNVWLTDSSLFSQQQISAIVNHPFTDTTGQVKIVEDTITMRFMAPRQPRVKTKKQPLQITYNIKGGVIKPGSMIVLTSPTPLRKPDTSLIKLYETTAEKKEIPVHYQLTADSTNALKYVIRAKLPESRKYLFIADSAAFRDLYGLVSDSAGIRFSIPKSSDFGKIIMNINDVSDPMIIQLLTKEEKVISEQKLKAPGKVTFPLLDKGKYRIRAIFDMNDDGQWTTGDFAKKRQPEPVTYYPNEIEVTIDWEAENDWSPQVKNLKDPKLRNVKNR